MGNPDLSEDEKNKLIKKYSEDQERLRNRIEQDRLDQRKRLKERLARRKELINTGVSSEEANVILNEVERKNNISSSVLSEKDKNILMKIEEDEKQNEKKLV